jgi:amino acid adenylation domain-containing protein
VIDPRIRPARLFVPFARADLDRSIPARFADQVARHGARPAIWTPRGALSYAEVDGASSRVAEAVLDALGASPAPVAVLLAQGALLLVAILGVLKAGKPYVPLDPRGPRSRLGTVLRHARAGLCLLGREHAALATTVADLGVRPLEVAPVTALPPAQAPRVEIPADRTAYIYYTSGTTGEPKGVHDTHRNVLHNVMRYTNTLGIGADDRLTLLQGPAFSGAVSSMFGALLNGAAVYPFDVPQEGADRVAPWLVEHALTMYHSVPALFRRVAAANRSLPALRVVRLEGDLAVPRDLALFQARCARGAALVNGLGATECGLVRQYVVDHTTALPPHVVPIGYPVEDMEVLLLDAASRPVGPGEVGEIVVRSRYVAAGYWDRPDLTDAAFGSAEIGGPRLYRTGDVGRMAADGCLEHLGRRDQQVKIRGARVDVEAIQAALLSSGAAREAVVTARRREHGDAHLVAYVVPEGAGRPSASALRRIVIARAPGEPVPASFVLLDALPLDVNGKVDRQALPAPGAERPELDVPFAPPRSDRERALSALWSEVLGGRAPIGVNDDFFDLGGDSLLAVELLVRVAEEMGVEVGATEFARRPTIAALAALVDRSPGARAAGGEHPAAPTLVFLHSEYGTAAECLTLARQLAPDLEVVSVAPHGADGEPVPATVEEMAARHVERLRALQPRGPYHLAGHCSAGVVAFEMGQQLRAAGEDVPTLILIEPPPLGAPRPAGARRGRLGPALGRRAWRGAARVLRRVGFAVDRGPFNATERDAADVARREVDRAYAAAVARYVARPWPGAVTCIRTRASERAGEFDPTTWRSVVDELRVELVPGDHESCLVADAPALAARLRASVIG